jgi:hypothetical protein
MQVSLRSLTSQLSLINEFIHLDITILLYTIQCVYNGGKLKGYIQILERIMIESDKLNKAFENWKTVFTLVLFTVFLF